MFTAAVAMLVGGGTHRAEAAGPSMLVSPATATAGNNTDINLDVNAADITLPGLGGYVIALQWNPAILSLTSLVDSGWVTSGSIIVACTTATIDNTLGNAELDCTPLFGFGSGVTTTAPQALAHATFHSLTYGTTVINLAGSSLLDPTAITIPSTITNGSLTVVLSVGGVARPPDQAELLSRRGRGHRGDELGFGAGAVVLAAAATGGLWVVARRSRRRKAASGR